MSRLLGLALALATIAPASTYYQGVVMWKHHYPPRVEWSWTAFGYVNKPECWALKLSQGAWGATVICVTKPAYDSATPPWGIYRGPGVPE